MDTGQPSNSTNINKQTPTTADEPLLKGLGNPENFRGSWWSQKIKYASRQERNHKALERNPVHILVQWTAQPFGGQYLFSLTGLHQWVDRGAEHGLNR